MKSRRIKMDKQKNLVYAGIGARDTPKEVCKFMADIAHIMARKGFVLRSGAAEGADSAFEAGCDRVDGRKVIYLPWDGFNHHNSPFRVVVPEAIDIGRQVHNQWYEECNDGTMKTWDEFSDGTQKLLSRNVYQMVGLNLNYLSRFALLWTDKEDDVHGGTAFAIRIAKHFDIPYLNMEKHEDDLVNATVNFIEQF